MASAEEGLRERLTQDLRAAIKARDRARIAALRTLAAALDNATAVPIEGRGVPMPFPTAEVPRKVLTEDDLRAILLREIAERHDAVFAFESHGCFEEALGLRAEIAIFEGYASEIASEDSGHQPRGAS